MMKKKFLKLAACFLSVAILAQSLPAMAGAPGDSDSASGRPDIVAKWLLEPAGAKREIAGNGAISANPDGSRNVQARDDVCVWGMKTALPAGTYYMKYWANIKRGSNSARLNENERPMFVGTAGGNVATNDLSAFPDGEWKQVIAQIVVPQNATNVMKEYSIKGPMPFIVGGDDAVCKIGREIVISTNSTPMPDQQTEYAFVTGKNGNTTCGGTENSDCSVTANDKTNSEELVKFNATVPAGTHYLKLSAKIAEIPESGDGTAPVAKLVNEKGESWNFPAASEYNEGVWKNNCIKFTSDGEKHTYSIKTLPESALGFSVAKDFTISGNDLGFDAPQNEIIDYSFSASDISQSLGCVSSAMVKWQNAYNLADDSLHLTPSLGTDRLVWGISPQVSTQSFINSGCIPKGKFYVKVLAKVSEIALSGTKNSPLFTIEKDQGSASNQQVENINFGEFTKADTYQTIVREFDASSTNNGVAASIQLRYFGGDNLSDLSVKKVVISSDPGAIDDTELATSDVSWPADQLLPSFPTPATTLVAIDMSGSDATVQDIVTARALQGIVNRKQPRITILESIESNTVNQYAWENSMGLKYKNVAGNNAHDRLINLIKMFKDEITGYIRYDSTEGNIQSLNVASTVCGIKNAIPIDASQEAFAIDLMLEKQDDLSGMGWGPSSAGRINAAEYLYKNYKGQYNDRVILNINPGTNKTEYNLGSINTRVRDLAAAMKIPVVWLDAKTSKEKTEINKFYDDMNAAHPSTEEGVCPVALGFFPTESEGVRQSSSKGITCVPSDNFGNYTVYSALSREIDPPAVPKKPELKNYNYVSIVSSDGDNICTSEGATRKNDMWDSQRRGQAKISWTISPALLDAAPQMLQYYLGGATENDTFVSGPSGLGYTQAVNQGYGAPQIFWPSTTWAANYGAWTNRYFEKTGLSSITVWMSTTAEMRTAFLSKFPALQGFFLQYAEGKRVADGSELYTEDIPSKNFNRYCYVDNSDTFNNDVTDAIKGLEASSSAKFYTYQPQTFAIRYDAMNNQQKSVEKENSSVKFVRSDHFFMLMNEANGKPINNALQAKTYASGSDDGYDCQKAVDGSFGKTHGWQSSAEGEKWLTVDFGKRLSVSRYVLKNAQTGYYPANTNTKDFKLQGSNDGRTWEDMDSVSGNTEDILYRNVDVAKKFRYVRVYITNPGADGVARIQDIELYGVNQSTPDDAELRAEVAESAKITSQGKYTQLSWNAFLKAKSNAEAFVASPDADATQLQIDDLTFALRDARESLSALKAEALLSALEDAGTVEPQPQLKPIYSKASWNEFSTAFAAAKAIESKLDEEPAQFSQIEVDLAAEALKNAIKGLGADKSELQAAVNAAPNESKKGDYASSGWNALQLQLEAARKVIKDSVKQYEFDEALTSLQEAVGNLVNISALKPRITQAGAKKQGDYTDSSWSTLQIALKNANAVLANAAATQSQVDAAAQNLSRAISSLSLRVKVVVVKSKKTLSLTVGKTSSIKATVSPAAAGNKKLIFSSSNKKLATVSSTGKIKARSPGKVVITVKSAESFVKAQITVKVNPKAPAKPKPKKSGRTVTVKFKKVKGTSGTQIFVLKNGRTYKKYKTTKSSYKIKLKKGRYSFKLKSYKKVKGKYYYSGYSKKAKYVVK